MKKIAFVTKGNLPVPAVSGGAVEILIDSLLNSNKINSKYKIDVYSIKSSKVPKLKNKNNINYYYIEEKGLIDKLKKITRFIFNKLLKKYIGNLYITKIIKKYKDRLKEYDYVIVENRPEYGLVLKKYIKGKLILHSHNDFIHNKHINDIMNYYDEIYCVSKFMCNRIKTNKEKVKLLYNGINIDKFNVPVDIKEERKKWNLKESDVVFLYTGRLIETKGVKELISAFNNVKKTNYKLLIVGSNNNKKYIKQLKRLSNNNSNIIYTGFLNYSDIQKIYKIADYGIVPSIWEEPFALTVVEHLASGHPVIITKSGGMPELVNSKCSIIIEKNKNIVENLTNTIEDIEYKKFNSDDCIKQAKKFSEEKYIDNFIKLLK